MEAKGNPDAAEKVAEDRGVLAGPGQKDAHLLEGDAPNRLAEQPARHGAGLLGLARGGDQLHGRVEDRCTLRRSEETHAESLEPGRNLGRHEGSEG
ncbi:MAG TPA: hypothetical protein VIC87_18310, partial [Vicinamibacteria bacterium]